MFVSISLVTPSLLSNVYFHYTWSLISFQQLDQLLGEQSSLRSELGIPDWREEREAQKPCTRPNAATFFPRAGCSKDICPRFPKRSATVPSSPSVSLQRKTELLQSSALATGHVKSTADPKEHHTSKKETKGPSQTKLDFKSFIQNVRIIFHLLPRSEMKYMWAGSIYSPIQATRKGLTTGDFYNLTKNITQNMKFVLRMMQGPYSISRW